MDFNKEVYALYCHIVRVPPKSQVGFFWYDLTFEKILKGSVDSSRQFNGVVKIYLLIGGLVLQMSSAFPNILCFVQYCDARALVCLSNDQIVILLEASECSTMVASNVRSELVCLEHQQLVFGLCYGCLNWLGAGVRAGEFRLLDLKEVPLVSKGLDLVLASEEVSISSPAST